MKKNKWIALLSVTILLTISVYDDVLLVKAKKPQNNFKFRGML